MRVRRPWLVVGHHHDAREEQFCLTVQRNAVTRVVGVSLSTYASAAAGALTEIELDVTREDVRALEAKCAELDAVRGIAASADRLMMSKGGSVEARMLAGKRARK